MKPSTIVRALSFRIPAWLSASPATVAPSPIRTQFDQRVTSELDALQSQDFGVSHSEFSSATWVIDALAASITTQKIALESLADVIALDSDRKLIDEYLDDNIDMLDACNEVSEKIEIVQKYIKSLSRVSHLLEGNFEPNPAITARARHMLASCNAIERSSNEMNRKSKLRKLLSRRLSHGGSTGATTQLGEILTGSKAVALYVCGILGMTLSFRSSKRMFRSIQLQSTNSWSFSLLGLHKKVAENRGSSGSTMLTEFRRTVEASRKLRDRIMKCQTESDQIGISVEELRRSNAELEENMVGLEGKVKELYKSLIDVRMALLNRLSRA